MSRKGKDSFPNTHSPSTPSVIAQLFALEDEARQGWVPKQPGWHLLAGVGRVLPQAGPSGGLGERHPVRSGVGERTGTGFLRLPFRHKEGQMEGEAPAHSSFVLLSQFSSEPVKMWFGDPCRLSLFHGPGWSGQGLRPGNWSLHSV